MSKPIQGAKTKRRGKTSRAAKPSGGLPLYKVFHTAAQSYLYDTATNRILPIDEDFAQHLERGALSPAELRELASDRHGGVLQPTSTLPLQSAPTFEQVQRTVESGCQQIVLELTRDCNLRCRYCVYSGNQPGKRGLGKQAMALETALAAVDYLAAHSSAKPRVAVGFFGGEPLLAADLIRRTTAHARTVLKGKELIFSVTTNGTLLSREMMDFLVENEFSTLVSIDGPRDMHDKYRVFAGGGAGAGGGTGMGSFDPIMRRIREFKAAYPDYCRDRLRLTMVLPPGSDFVQLEKWLRENDLTAGHAGPIADDTGQYDAAYQTQPVTGVAQLREEFIAAAADGTLATRRAEAGFSLASRLFSPAMLALHRRPVPTAPDDRTIRRGMCVPGCERLFVDCTGELYPCEKTDGQRHVHLGHISTGVDVARACQILQEFHAFLASECASCWMWRICRACLPGPSLGHGYDQAKAQTMCQSLRTEMTDMLQIYCTILERNPAGLDCYLAAGAEKPPGT